MVTQHGQINCVNEIISSKVIVNKDLILKIQPLTSISRSIFLYCSSITFNHFSLRPLQWMSDFVVILYICCHSQLHNVPMNANTHFQVQFGVCIGAGNSFISVNDICLFEKESPHHIWHITKFKDWGAVLLAQFIEPYS